MTSAHIGDGVYIERLPDNNGHGIGAVRIYRRDVCDGNSYGTIVYDYVMSCDSWCQILAIISGISDKGLAFAMLRLIHQGICEMTKIGNGDNNDVD